MGLSISQISSKFQSLLQLRLATQVLSLVQFLFGTFHDYNEIFTRFDDVD